MAYWMSDFFTGTATMAAITVKPTYLRPMISVSSAGQIVHTRARMNFPTAVNPATNDVIEVCVLPAGCVPVYWTLYNDDMGSAELVAKMGLMTGTPGDITRALATVGEEIFLATGTQFQQANLYALNSAALVNSHTAATQEAFMSIAANAADRSIGIGWATEATTPTSGSTRNIVFDLWYRYGTYGY